MRGMRLASNQIRSGAEGSLSLSLSLVAVRKRINRLPLSIMQIRGKRDVGNVCEVFRKREEGVDESSELIVHTHLTIYGSERRRKRRRRRDARWPIVEITTLNQPFVIEASSPLPPLLDGKLAGTISNRILTHTGS